MGNAAADEGDTASARVGSAEAPPPTPAAVPRLKEEEASADTADEKDGATGALPPLLEGEAAACTAATCAGGAKAAAAIAEAEAELDAGDKDDVGGAFFAAAFNDAAAADAERAGDPSMAKGTFT